MNPDLEQEIERRMKELTSAMFPRKSFPISHCDLVRKSLREMAAFTRKQTLEEIANHKGCCDRISKRELLRGLQKGEEQP